MHRLAVLDDPFNYHFVCGSFNRNLDLCEESMSEAASNIMYHVLDEDDEEGGCNACDH